MEVTGKIIAITPVESGTSKAGRAWAKRFIVVETQEQYPRKIACTVFGEDRVHQFESVAALGDMVRVSFDIDSREFNGRWYTDVSAWRLERADNTAAAAAPVQAPAAGSAAAGFPAPPAPVAPAADEDLPF